MNRGLVRTVAALAVLGLALRTQVLGLGPLIPALRADLGIDHASAGILGTIPVLGMGLLAPLGPIVAARIGATAAAALCVAIIGGFGMARALVPGAPAVFLATVGIGVGLGLVGPVLAMLVRASMPGRPSLGTGSYVTGMIVGGSIAAAVSVPLADVFGGWRGSLLAISAVAGLSLVGWWILGPRLGPVGGSARATASAEGPRPIRPPLPWRRGLAWHLGLTFAVQSSVFHGCVAWLATIFVERGWSAAEAAGTLAMFNVSGLAGAIAVPLVADRLGSRRVQLGIAASITVCAIIGVALLPPVQPGAPAALALSAALGFGLWAFFPLVLILPVDVGDRPADAAALSSMMLLVGYLIAALAPTLLGAIRDATGDFTVSLWMLVAFAITMLPLSLTLSPKRLATDHPAPAAD